MLKNYDLNVSKIRNSCMPVSRLNPFSQYLPRGEGGKFCPPLEKNNGGIFLMCYQKIKLKIDDFRHNKNWGQNLKKWQRFWDFKIFAREFVIVIKCPSFSQMSVIQPNINILRSSFFGKQLYIYIANNVWENKLGFMGSHGGVLFFRAPLVEGDPPFFLRTDKGALEDFPKGEFLPPRGR